MIWKNKGHEFEELGKRLASASKLYLYGIGSDGQEILQMLDGTKKWIHWDIRLVDRNPKFQREGCRGRRVLSPEEFYDEATGDYLVVACPFSAMCNEITELLLSHGIPKERIISGFEFSFTCVPLYFLYRHNMVFFTSQNIVPSTICNLNCRDCLNFTPYIKKHTVHTLEEEKADVDVFFRAVELIFRFQITGGEPLLYPHLHELIEYIDQNYRSHILRLEMVTNGTVIPSDELCDYLAQKDMYLFLDDYTMTLDAPLAARHDQVKEQLARHGVRFSDNHVDRWFRLYPPLTQRDRSPAGLANLFDTCSNPWSTIENGRISACNYALYAAKAGVCDDNADEYYDLRGFDESQKAALIEFRLRCNHKGYTAMCGKCEGFSVINQNWCEPAIQTPKGEQP